MLLATALIFLAALWRIATVYHPALFNVAPVTALAFCGAVYLRNWRWGLVPLAALGFSDLWLNHYHATVFGYTWTLTETLLRAACAFDQGAVGLDHRQRLDGAAGLRQTDGVMRLS